MEHCVLQPKINTMPYCGTIPCFLYVKILQPLVELFSSHFSCYNSEKFSCEWFQRAKHHHRIICTFKLPEKCKKWCQKKFLHVEDLRLSLKVLNCDSNKIPTMKQLPLHVVRSYQFLWKIHRIITNSCWENNVFFINWLDLPYSRSNPCNANFNNTLVIIIAHIVWWTGYFTDSI